MDELQKSSDSATQENGLLRAQVERLQVELREYRKRLSWMSNGGSGLTAMSSLQNAPSKGASGLRTSEFLFDFPKFGDLPGAHLFNGQPNKNEQSKPKDGVRHVPGVLSRDSLNGAGVRIHSLAQSNSSNPTGNTNTPSLSGSSNASVKPPHRTVKPSSASTQYTSTSESPSSSSDSHQSQLLSSNGTSPEPSSNSPLDGKANGPAYPNTDGEESFCAQLRKACGSINNPIPAAQENAKSGCVECSQPAPVPAHDTVGFDWLAQQNGGQFDPVLFGDWREPQDAVLSQDFGSFFNDAFPLPDLGSPSHNLTELASTQPPKKEMTSRAGIKLDDEEVVPGEDNTQMLTCTKIWYVPCSESLVLTTTNFSLQGPSTIHGEIPQRRDRRRQPLLGVAYQSPVL